MKERENQEYTILKVVASADQPVGSGLLREILDKQGRKISEATAGRLLRELDFKGYTERVGYQGRVLTQDGKQQLEELGQRYEHTRYGDRLIKSLQLDGKQDLLDILVARRAIETEIAGLAAENASTVEISAMRQVLRKQELLIREGQTGAKEDIEFHQGLAKASRNRVLSAAIDLIRQNGQLSPVLEIIRREVKGELVEDHLQILRAVGERNAKKAAEHMYIHIQGLIQDVEKYWEV